MTPAKAKEVIARYKKHFEDCGIAKRAMNRDVPCPSPLAVLEHCHHMIAAMEEMIGREEDREKFARWLGWMQGVLCVCQVYTLKEKMSATIIALRSGSASHRNAQTAGDRRFYIEKI